MISSTTPPTGRASFPSPACHKSFSRLTLIARHPSLPRRNEIFLIGEFFTAADTLPPAPPPLEHSPILGVVPRNARQGEKDRRDAGCVMAFFKFDDDTSERRLLFYEPASRGDIARYCFVHLDLVSCITIRMIYPTRIFTRLFSFPVAPVAIVLLNNL